MCGAAHCLAEQTLRFQGICGIRRAVPPIDERRDAVRSDRAARRAPPREHQLRNLLAAGPGTDAAAAFAAFESARGGLTRRLLARDRALRARADLDVGGRLRAAG